jgi:hypothetical protein
MEDVGGNLTKKIGPFPVWVYGVLIGGAFVLWYWVSQRDAGSSAVADAVSEGDLGTVETPSGDFSVVPVMPPSDGVVDEHTNLEWSIQALNAVTGTGVSLIAAQTAISKYLNGEKLTSSEGSVINTILSKIGPPPEGVSTPDVTPAPPGPGATNWNTKTTVTAYKGTWFGNPLVITAKVDWVNPAGHTFKPRGFVEIALDGALAKRYRLLNGVAIRTLTVSRNVSQFKDKVIVITAKFLPNTGTSEKASAASPWTTQILNK